MRRRPLVISHRTQMGSMPENTVAGIEAAIAAGADGVEGDVRLSRDGIAVLLHDETLERTTGDPRTLAEVTGAELRRLRVLDPHGRAGPQPVPTLAEALRAVNGRCLLVVEIKEMVAVTAVARDIRAAGAETWCWAWAFDPAVAVASHGALPDVPVSLLVAPGSEREYGYDSPYNLAARSGFAGVSLARPLTDAGAIAAAHTRGLSLYCWTVDDPEEMLALAETGVDAICSNFPERAPWRQP